MTYNKCDKMGKINLTHYLVHLTKSNSKENLDELGVLFKILEDKVLVGSTTPSEFIVGDTPAVCLQAAPVSNIIQNVNFQENNGNLRYSKYGLLFSKSFIYKNHGRPVIYDKTPEAKKYLKESEWWRIVNLDLCSNNIKDWSYEKEWRVPTNLNFEYSDISVIVPNDIAYRKFINMCLDNGKEEILRNICGITNLSRLC